jgi:uncharacterized damage-inducible protein DinB
MELTMDCGFARTSAIVALVCLSAGNVVAQQDQTQVSVTAPLDSQYAGDLTALHNKVLALAEAIPAESYAWRPSSQVRTVAQLLMHIAGEWYSLCPRSVGAKPPADFGPPAETMHTLEEIATKPEVMEHLRRSWTHCRSSLDNVDPRRLVPDSLPARMGFPRVVLLVAGDQHEHLGQLIAYARSVGVTPPWSR